MASAAEAIEHLEEDDHNYVISITGLITNDVDVVNHSWQPYELWVHAPEEAEDKLFGVRDAIEEARNEFLRYDRNPFFALQVLLQRLDAFEPKPKPNTPPATDAQLLVWVKDQMKKASVTHQEMLEVLTARKIP